MVGLSSFRALMRRAPAETRLLGGSKVDWIPFRMKVDFFTQRRYP